MQRLAEALLLSMILTAFACGEEGPSAPAPSMSGGGPFARGDSGSMPDAAGPDSGMEDASSAGAGGGAGGSGGMAASTPARADECDNVEPVMFVGGDPSVDVVASTVEPADFEVTRVVATWEASCSVPTIRVELSDGSCPLGKGHVLTFWFTADAIDSGAIAPGLNTVRAEPDNLGVRIRYVRPSRLDLHGEWGTCTGASATFNMLGDPATAAFSDLEVSRFDLLLTACDGSDNDPILVTGSFDVELQRGLEEVCPDK